MRSPPRARRRACKVVGWGKLGGMKWIVKLVAEVVDGKQIEHEIATIERADRISPATVGLTIAEGKGILESLDPTGRLMALEVKAIGARLELGTPRSLFQTHAASPGARPFDVSHTADRFVITTTGNVNPTPFTLIVNWTAELKK